jgi:hypothetical protein
MKFRRLPDVDDDRDDDDIVRRDAPRRPWALIVGSLLLAVLVVVLWFRWTETRMQTTKLRAELKDVYAEAEKYRLEVAQGQQRLSVLEGQVASMRAERDEAVSRLAASSSPKAKPTPPPTRPRR